MLLTSIAVVSGPYLVKIAVDSGLEAGSLEVLRRTVLLYLLMLGVQWTTIFLRVNIMARVGQGIIYDLRAGLFSHLQTLSLSFFNHFSVARVITRVINDVGTLREFVTWATLAIVRDVLAIIGIIIAMLLLDVRLSLITFTVLPLMAVATIGFRRAARRNYRKVRAAVSWTNSVLAENVNGVRVVQAFSRQPYNYKNFREYVNRYYLERSLDAAKVASLFTPVVDVLGAVATAVVVYIGGTMVLDATMTAGDLVAFVLYIDRLFDPGRATEYAAEDADCALAVHEALYPRIAAEPRLREVYESIELPVMGVLLKMERNGVLLDRAKLEAQSHELGKEMLALEEKAYAAVGQPFNLNSPKQIQEILFERQKLPVRKRTPSGQPSTDEDVLAELALDYPLPRLLLDYRALAKLKSTYTDKLPKMVQAGTGRVHTTYSQAVAVTVLRQESHGANEVLQDVKGKMEEQQHDDELVVPSRQLEYPGQQGRHSHGDQGWKGAQGAPSSQGVDCTGSQGSHADQGEIELGEHAV